MSTERLDICVKSRAALAHELKAAEKGLQQAATQSVTRGILITRVLPRHYTAELSERVPFGITKNCYLDVEPRFVFRCGNSQDPQ